MSGRKLASLFVAVLVGAGVARADAAVPGASVGWVQACEAQLRAATEAWDRGLDFPTVDLFRRWDWRVGDGEIELHYTNGRTNEEYRIRISSGRGRRSSAWRESAVRRSRSPTGVEAWRLDRVAHGRRASIRAGATAGRPRFDAFWKRFRPVVDGCLEE